MQQEETQEKQEKQEKHSEMQQEEEQEKQEKQARQKLGNIPFNLIIRRPQRNAACATTPWTQAGAQRRVHIVRSGVIVFAAASTM